MARAEPLWLVVNSASGSNTEEALAQLHAGLEASQCGPARTLDCKADTLPDRAALEAAGVSRLAIYTGDGTLNSVLNGIEGWQGEVLVLPGGTANLLAHAIHGEVPAGRIVALFGAGQLEPRRRTCIECSAGRALIELLAGPGATWSDVREGMREGDVAAIASATIEAVRQSAGGPMVEIVKPQVGREGGYAGVRFAPGDGGLEVEGYGAETVADYLLQGVALLRRDFRTGPHDELGTFPSLTCRSADGSPIELMIDGERATGAGEECFAQRPFAVTFLATPESLRDDA
jgi:hypothetical protein